MSARLTHFAINADDVERTRRFYEGVFGWTFTPWGPPDFYRIHTGNGDQPALHGALQRRRELVPGARTIGFECTIGVTDIDATARAALAHGGEMIMERTTIVDVGDLIFVADPSGNVVGAIRHHDNAG